MGSRRLVVERDEDDDDDAHGDDVEIIYMSNPGGHIHEGNDDVGDDVALYAYPYGRDIVYGNCHDLVGDVGIHGFHHPVRLVTWVQYLWNYLYYEPRHH